MSDRSFPPGRGLDVEGIEPTLVGREWSIDDPSTTQLVLLTSRQAALLEPARRSDLLAPALAMLPALPGEASGSRRARAGSGSRSRTTC